MTALDNFVVNVSDLEQRRLRSAVGDPSSRTGTPRQDAGRRKVMKRAVDGHARGTEGVRQFRLGRYAIALGPGAAVNLGEHEALDSRSRSIFAPFTARRLMRRVSPDVSFHPGGSVPMRASCGVVHQDRRHFLT